MSHESNIRFVDPHTKGDRRHHHDPLLAQEELLVESSLLRCHASVIGNRADSLFAQPFCCIVDLLPTSAVDDASLAGMSFSDHP